MAVPLPAVDAATDDRSDGEQVAPSPPASVGGPIVPGDDAQAEAAEATASPDSKRPESYWKQSRLDGEYWGSIDKLLSRTGRLSRNAARKHQENQVELKSKQEEVKRSPKRQWEKQAIVHGKKIKLSSPSTSSPSSTSPPRPSTSSSSPFSPSHLVHKHSPKRTNSGPSAISSPSRTAASVGGRDDVSDVEEVEAVFESFDSWLEKQAENIAVRDVVPFSQTGVTSTTFDGDYWCSFNTSSSSRNQSKFKHQQEKEERQAIEKERLVEQEAKKERHAALRQVALDEGLYERDPETFLYTYVAPDVEERLGAWQSKEKKAFVKAVSEQSSVVTSPSSPGSSELHWGALSMSVPGRTGKRCRQFYFTLLSKGEIVSPMYDVSATGKVTRKVKLTPQEREEQERRHVERKKRQALVNARKLKEREILHQQWEEWKRTESRGSLVFPNVYIGSKVAAQNLQWMLDDSVTLIINCTRSLPNYLDDHPSGAAPKYLRIPVDDSHDEAPVLITHAVELALDIKRVVADGGSVFIHCVQGKSRSAAMILVYAMRCLELSLEDAMKQLTDARSVCRPNDGFWGHLLEFEKRILSVRARDQDNDKSDDMDVVEEG